MSCLFTAKPNLIVPFWDKNYLFFVWLKHKGQDTRPQGPVLSPFAYQVLSLQQPISIASAIHLLGMTILPPIE